MKNVQVKFFKIVSKVFLKSNRFLAKELETTIMHFFVRKHAVAEISVRSHFTVANQPITSITIPTRAAVRTFRVVAVAISSACIFARKAFVDI